ncbi:hypothetical protein CLF_100638 [Clonorchis sinensis]|uniref:Uncharacterized protein n=1 Tax=Clonorchis sinensis TaxID=79923 RepID=G7Y3X1_CLOSI|nr:hypothetical protein CLF_100638 [Clonorchis sinensis]
MWKGTKTGWFVPSLLHGGGRASEYPPEEICWCYVVSENIGKKEHFDSHSYIQKCYVNTKNYRGINLEAVALKITITGSLPVDFRKLLSQLNSILLSFPGSELNNFASTGLFQRVFSQCRDHIEVVYSITNDSFVSKLSIGRRLLHGPIASTAGVQVSGVQVSYVPVSGSPSRETAVTSATEFADNGFHTSLSSPCLTSSGSFAPFAWLCEKNPTRKSVDGYTEHVAKPRVHRYSSTAGKGVAAVAKTKELPLETDIAKVVNCCCINYKIDEDPIPLKPDRETAVNSATEFADNDFYTSLASGSFPHFAWLCEKNPSRMSVDWHTEHCLDEDFYVPKLVIGRNQEPVYSEGKTLHTHRGIAHYSVTFTVFTEIYDPEVFVDFVVHHKSEHWIHTIQLMRNVATLRRPPYQSLTYSVR